MINFEYEVRGKFIKWQCTWNGQFDDQEKEMSADGNPDHHPFYRTLDYRDLFHWTDEGNRRIEPLDEKKINLLEIGDTVAANPATLEMCKMLSSPETIKEHSGNHCSYAYYAVLLGALSELWD